ncbi:MAG: MutS-related protein, partial [Acidimicrobiales bacterium]
MKAYLMHPGYDFDTERNLPAHTGGLAQDLGLGILCREMGQGDKLVSEVCLRALVLGLGDVEAIAYRQRVLADCLAQPEVIREMYAVAVAALLDRRQIWGGYGGTYQTPSSNLSGAVSTLETYVAR